MDQITKAFEEIKNGIMTGIIVSAVLLILANLIIKR